MNKSKKIWLGILAFLPLVCGVTAIIFMFTSFVPAIMRFEQQGNHNDLPIAFFAELMPLFIVAIFASILTLLALIYFIIHAINNLNVKSEERIVWVLVFIFASSIGFPIYWCIRIWPDPKTESNFVKL